MTKRPGTNSDNVLRNNGFICRKNQLKSNYKKEKKDPVGHFGGRCQSSQLWNSEKCLRIVFSEHHS